MSNVYQIKEYGSFVCNKNIPGYVSLPEKTFSILEEFILTNQVNQNEPIEIMGVSARKGIGKIITAKNYIGTIKMVDGTVIEILPKIYSEIDDDEKANRTKKIVVDMLRTLRGSPFKSFQMNQLHVENMSIFEMFIRMFIDEVFFVVKRGLKCSYERKTENANYYKGKIKFSLQLKYNTVHRERNYIEYDAFNVNRAENRLIKSTLEYLYRSSSSFKNKSDIKILLASFAQVEVSCDYEGDFAKCAHERNMRDYDTALVWSNIFLRGKSFTSFTGSEIAATLLFPMESLFESYIATLLKRALGNDEYLLSTQDRKHYLFDQPDKKFLIKPDIVVTKKTDLSVVIMDTKWKLLSEKKNNYGISQSDMYQMYAYQKKYKAKSTILVYPKTESISENSKIEFISEDGAVVKVCFIDLFEVDNEISKLIIEDLY